MSDKPAKKPSDAPPLLWESGIEIKPVSLARVEDFYNSISAKEAAAETELWIRRALVSEFSFFTESSRSFGLKLDL